MATELTSVRSPRVAAARRLGKRAFREADGRFLAEGPQAVREALAEHVTRGGVVTEVFVTTAAAQRLEDLVRDAESAGVPVVQVSGEVMSGIAQTVTPQGIAAICVLRGSGCPRCWRRGPGSSSCSRRCVTPATPAP